MPFVCTAAEHKLLDQTTVRDCQIPAILLMENAGRAVAERCQLLCPKKGRVLVLCGGGNNGGDGFVTARVLCDAGYDVRVLLFVRDSNFRNEAKQSYDMLRFGCPSCYPGMLLEYVPDNPDENWLAARIGSCDLLVDAIFGISLSRPLAGNIAKVVDYCNNHARCPVVAVDMPSGIKCDSGLVEGVALAADETVTFGALKPGLLLEPAASYAGKIQLAAIGFPKFLYRHLAFKGRALAAEEVARLLPERPKTAYKNMFGHVVVIGGSVGKIGALALCTQGVLRSGAGLCTVVSSDKALATMRELPAEAMTIPCQDKKYGDLPQLIISTIGQRGAVALGPGWEEGPEEGQLLHDLCQLVPRPLVMDAAALRLLAASPNLLPVGKKDVVLTPHPGEMSALIRLPVADIQASPVAAALRLASQYKVTVVLKGAPTVIAGPEGEWTINTTGNNGLATGGSGDLLTGVIAALLAQGLTGYEAASLGVYLHGLAADLAREKIGGTALLPSDVAGNLGSAFQQLEVLK